jgi:hypothetical protein
VADRFSAKGLLIGSLVVSAGLVAAIYSTTGTLMRLFSMTPYVLASLGCFIGASAFERNERLYWAWMIMGLGNLFGAPPVIIFGKLPLHAPTGPDLSSTEYMVLVGLDILLNIFTVVGLVLFAQVWRSLGARSRWYPIATVIALGVGAAMTVPALLHSMHNLQLGGTHDELGSIISSLGDLTAITMIGPLVVTAIAMRGGAFMWPFLFLATGTLSWLFYDVFGVLAGTAQTISDLSFSTVGLMLTGAAGVAHRRALKG